MNKIEELYEKMSNIRPWDRDYNPFKIFYSAEKDIHKLTPDKSDISCHLPLLRFLASQCNSILEFGVRKGNSTIAFLMGNPKSLISIDINPTPLTYELGKLSNWQFIQAMSIDPKLLELVKNVDLLFVDSDHSYINVMDELKMWHNRVNKWIVFHDSFSIPDVANAIKDFLLENKMWKIVYETKLNHGLLIVQKVE